MDNKAYIGRCRQRSGVVLAVLDTPQHASDVAKDVFKVIRGGDYVERITIEEGREALAQWCQCALAEEIPCAP